ALVAGNARPPPAIADLVRACRPARALRLRAAPREGGRTARARLHWRHSTSTTWQPPACWVSEARGQIVRRKLRTLARRRRLSGRSPRARTGGGGGGVGGAATPTPSSPRATMRKAAARRRRSTARSRPAHP